MSDVEDRLRQDLPALADALIAGRAADSAGVEEPEGAVDAVAPDPGPFVGLGSLPLGRKRRWPAVAAAAATVAAVVGVGAFLLGTTDSTQVTTVDPAAARPDEAPETVAPAGAGESMEGIAPDAGGPKGGLETPARSAAPDGPRVTPAELSSGPVLQWSEIDPGLAGLYRIRSVGDGRVLAFTGGDSGGEVVVTTNGTDWTELSVPDGIDPEHIDISGDRWLVAGRREDSSPRGDMPKRVFFSDDRGRTWTEIAVNVPAASSAPTPMSPYVLEWSGLASALVSGEHMVIVVWSRVDLDLHALLADRGLLADGKSLFGWFAGNGLVKIDVGDAYDPENPEAFTRVGSESIELTYDQLALTTDQQRLLEGHGDSWIRLFWSDGSTAELAAEYKGWGATGVGTETGFVLHVLGPVEVVVESPDGRVWNEIPTDAFEAYAPPPRGVDEHGTIWSTVRLIGAASVVKNFSYGEDPTTVAILRGLELNAGLAVGPAGLAATARPLFGVRSNYSVDRGLSGRVSKDGYELRYGEPPYGVTVWDLAADAAIYVFEKEDLTNDAWPPGVREFRDSDGEWSAVLLQDPETRADLVTFTRHDIAEVFGTSLFLDDDEIWIGWSEDGVAWGWQTVADAFGATDNQAKVRLAVGRDFVLALVQEASAVEPRLSIARVPL